MKNLLRIGCLAGFAAALAFLSGRGGIFKTRAGTPSPNHRTRPEYGVPQPVSGAVFRFSVIPGGVRYASAVKRVIAKDDLVRDHYAQIDVGHLQRVTVTQPFEAFVSYRKNERIFWTSRRVWIRAGEEILLSGDQRVRARCGNRISETPQRPVAHNPRDEPALAELDSIVSASNSPEQVAAAAAWRRQFQRSNDCAQCPYAGAPPDSAVPEPASLALSAIGLATLLLFKKTRSRIVRVAANSNRSR